MFLCLSDSCIICLEEFSFSSHSTRTPMKVKYEIASGNVFLWALGSGNHLHGFWGVAGEESNTCQVIDTNRAAKTGERNFFFLFSSWFESIHRSKRRLGRAGKVCSVNNRLMKEKKKKETLKRCCKTLVRNSQMTLISRYCIRSCCMMRVRVVERTNLWPVTIWVSA